MMARRILFGYHPDWMVHISQLIDHSRFNPSFAPFELVDLSAFDLVVPLALYHYPPLRGRDEARAFLPQEAHVALCDDKLAFARWLIGEGFGAMVPALLPEDAPAYPHVVKPRHGEFGSGCRILWSAADEQEPVDPAMAFRQQAVLGGSEYALHLLRVGGAIRYVQAYRYEMGTPLSIRGAARAPLSCDAVDPGPALDAARAILDRLDYRGTCCFGYKIDAAGAVRILELNPRFGGSLVGDINRYLEACLAAMEHGA